MSTPSRTLKLAPDLIWRLLDDNAVVVSPKVGEVRVLNRVGTIIWQQLVDGKSPAEVEDYLVANFQVSDRQAQSDLLAFCDELTDRGVLIWETGERS
jgi:hypothetical protein